VTLTENAFSVVTAESVQFYWAKITGKSSMEYLTWWTNGTQFVGGSISNDTLVAKWVYFGHFAYTESSGDVGAHFIEAKQLIFLNETAQMVYFGFGRYHAVA
jgi:hypothetical protein